MKCIVLTHDLNHPIAEFVIDRYFALWPDHPFEFRVPFNETFPESLVSRYGHRIEPVETSRAVDHTIDGLTRDLPASEWIFWSQDDKCPSEIELPAVEELAEQVPGLADPNLAAVLLGSPPWRPPKGFEFSEAVGPVEFGILRRHLGFWSPHFMRVAQLRHVMVDSGFAARNLQRTQNGAPSKLLFDFNPWEIEMPGPETRILVPERMLLTHYETLIGGELTTQAADEMEKLSYPIPDMARTDAFYFVNRHGRHFSNRWMNPMLRRLYLFALRMLRQF